MKEPVVVIDKIINAIGAAMLFFMIGLSAFNIACNWLTGKRFGQVEELVLCCFVWLVYIGMGSLYRTKEHISVSFLVQMMPEKMQKAISVVDDIVMFAGSCVIAYYAWELTVRGVDKYTATLKLQYCYIDIAVVLGFLYIIIDLACKFAKCIRRNMHKTGGAL